MVVQLAVSSRSVTIKHLIATVNLNCPENSLVLEQQFLKQKNERFFKYFVYFSMAPGKFSDLMRSLPSNLSFSASSFSSAEGGAFFLI
jgi:hypothetical protein